MSTTDAPAFTPGPWYVLDGEYRKHRGRKFPVVYAPGEELKYVAYCDDQLYFYEPTNNLANAHLIAAAPCMYETLSDFVEEYVALVNSGDAGNWDPEKEPKVIAARAALDKAQGK